MSQNEMLGWYFSENPPRLGYGDGRIIRAGETHSVDCEPVLCQSGLHASERPIDALGYAPGPYIWRVRLGGKIVRGDDKAVATQRTYLWGFDATDTLHEFARWCARSVANLWYMPAAVRRYLDTGDETTRAVAWACSRAAAWAAARAAVWDAARDAQNAQLLEMLTARQEQTNE